MSRDNCCKGLPTDIVVFGFQFRPFSDAIIKNVAEKGSSMQSREKGDKTKFMFLPMPFSIENGNFSKCRPNIVWSRGTKLNAALYSRL